HPALERVGKLGGVDRERLELTEDVREPETDEADVALTGEVDDVVGSERGVRHRLRNVTCPAHGRDLSSSGVRYRIAIVGLAMLLGACGSSSGGSTSGGGSGSGSGSGSGRATCGPSGGRTLAASSSARVYVSGDTVYACSGKSRVALGRAGV